MTFIQVDNIIIHWSRFIIMRNELTLNEKALLAFRRTVYGQKGLTVREMNANNENENLNEGIIGLLKSQPIYAYFPISFISRFA